MKKSNGRYHRISNFEILNTEIRTLLFKHSYGYDLSLIDFGRLQTFQTANSMQMRNVPALPLSEAQIVKPEDVTFGLNFLYRDFGIVRVKTMSIRVKNEAIKE